MVLGRRIFGSLDGGEDDEYNGIGSGEISRIYFVMHGIFFRGTWSFCGVYRKIQQ